MKNRPFLHMFLGDAVSPETKTIRAALRERYGPPAPRSIRKVQAPPAPENWRTDKTARALGKAQ